jgi:hypothetical protein
VKFAYQRTGRPLLQWGLTSPSQSRGADARSLGSLSGDTLGALPLPLPGAPEPVQFGCSGCTGMGRLTLPGELSKHGGLSGAADIPNILNNAPLPYKIAAGVGAYLLYKAITKKRR